MVLWLDQETGSKGPFQYHTTPSGASKTVILALYGKRKKIDIAIHQTCYNKKKIYSFQLFD